MSRAQKIALGLASVLPLLHCASYVAAGYPGWIFHALWAVAAKDGRVDGFEAATVIAAWGLLLAATVILLLGVLITYVIHAGRPDRLPANRTLIWRILLVIGSVIAIPAYWYLYIWRERPTQS
jgi:hypothetical protein